MAFNDFARAFTEKYLPVISSSVQKVLPILVALFACGLSQSLAINAATEVVGLV